MKHYAERDIMEQDRQGGHYIRHVEAMTAEGLHSKSDIAAELAHRDIRIAALEAALTAAIERLNGYEESPSNDDLRYVRDGTTPTETPPHLRGPIIQAHADTNGVPPQSETGDVKNG